MPAMRCTSRFPPTTPTRPPCRALYYVTVCPPHHPLSSKLSDSENTLLAKAAIQAGLPGGKTALQPMKPWLAALTLSVAPLLKAGMDPKGCRQTASGAHENAGKPVYGLETAEQQVRILADLPESVQLALLRSTLHDYAHAGTEFKATVKAWLEGDTQRIASLLAEQMQKQSTALYKQLLIDRNRQWAHDIATLMRKHARYHVHWPSGLPSGRPRRRASTIVPPRHYHATGSGHVAGRAGNCRISPNNRVNQHLHHDTSQ